MERRRPSATADEKTMLADWLAWQHATVVIKCHALADADAHRAPISTSPDMSIAALVSHLTVVERDWLEGSFLGDEDILAPDSEGGWEVRDRSLAELMQGYRRQGSRSLEIIAQHELDELEAFAPPGMQLLSLRWIVTHLLEETGRHLGHLDLLRELADGSRGQ